MIKIKLVPFASCKMLPNGLGNPLHETMQINGDSMSQQVWQEDSSKHRSPFVPSVVAIYDGNVFIWAKNNIQLFYKVKFKPTNQTCHENACLKVFVLIST